MKTWLIENSVWLIFLVVVLNMINSWWLKHRAFRQTNPTWFQDAAAIRIMLKNQSPYSDVIGSDVKLGRKYGKI